MKKTLYYFSGTGNCLAIARDLAESLTGDIEIVPIAKHYQKGTSHIETDLVVIIYPAWLHHIPPMVEEFVKKLSLNGAFVSVICTYARNPYNSLFHINELLEQKGSHIAAGYTIAMPRKYVLLVDLTFPNEENMRRLVDERKKVKEIANILEERKVVGIEGKPVQDDSDLIDYHKNVYRVVEKFRVTDRCDLCGVCVKVCPKSSISLVNNKLEWNDQCEYCLACLHWCPQAAIENGDISPNARRNHHPEITVNDIIDQK